MIAFATKLKIPTTKAKDEFLTDAKTALKNENEILKCL